MALEPDPPLVRSTPDVRHAVWQALVRAGFTEEALQGRPGWQGVEFAGDDRYWKQTVSNDASDPQAWLARLFLSGARVAADSAATPWLDAVERDAFLRTDLVRWATPDGPAAQLIAPVMLAPMSAGRAACAHRVRPAGANGALFRTRHRPAVPHRERPLASYPLLYRCCHPVALLDGREGGRTCRSGRQVTDACLWRPVGPMEWTLPTAARPGQRRAARGWPGAMTTALNEPIGRPARGELFL